MNDIEIIDYLEKISKKENTLFEYNNNIVEKSKINGFDIENNINYDEQSIIVSAIVDKKKGKYKIKDINKTKIKEGIIKAKKLAKIKTEKEIDCFGKGLPKKKIKFDKNIEKIDFGKLLEETKKNLVKEKYITSYVGDVYKVKNKNYTITNNLTEIQEKQYITSQFTINTKKQKQNSGFFYNIFTKKEDVNIENTIKQAKINANNLLSPKQGEKGNYKLILTPEIVQEILSYFVLDACKGDAIYRKESYLNNLKNKEIFSKNLSIIEHPHLDYFLGSSLVDEEAIKTNQKTIIDKGVFKKIIYNQKYGLLTNNKSTGNCFSGISFTNVLQEPGKKKINTIIENTKKGLLVYSIMGVHTNDLVTGDFSLTIANAKEIVDGKYNRTVTNLNFTGNIKDILKKMNFSKEQMFFGTSLFSFGVVDNIKII